MANNIYVGGFPYKTTKEDLAKLFSACGTVLSAKVILDRETGRPKGFGFVEMSTDAEAKAAVEKLNGAFVGDRKIFVVEGRPQKDRPAGYAPKPSFAAPAGDPPKANRPGFVERRSGKDRRGQPAASDRRDSAPPPAAPAAPAAPFAKKPWVKKPFDAAKKPWEKKPFDAAKKPWERKPFDAAKKPWEKKPFDAAKKPFERKPPVRGPKWVPKKD
ncbi:MAG: RNA-binding protein [Elusimicrobia bacterium]|nr:RNA-binding protein [Elusimicrobiota bacterium]